MCSNRSRGSYRELQDDNSISCSCPKKQKKDKIRRRGPGVAELEKIRLQQEIKSPIFRSPVSPFSSYFSNGSFSPANQHSSSLHHQMMNHPNPSPGSGRFYQFIELPSNQRSCVNTNVSQCLEEEQKLVSERKPWHCLRDTSKASIGSISSPVQDSGTTSSNSIAIGSFPRHYPKFNPVSLQYEQQEEEEAEFDENMQWNSKKPFYNFISSDVKNNSDQEQGLFERYESDADLGIDLNLKL